ncbi:endonuclease domain-containing protein [Dokdonella ginsengisoli]|uniref:DUF559 domain-containing protein n=1 Tax=Dokdonella ginsengisoli TaxID=363846 RepID=A0ABV9QUJ3_9GAMM
MHSRIENARALRRRATDAEQKLWYFLRNRRLSGYRFRRQVPLGGYVADFACMQARLVVELDGGQHVDRRVEDEARARHLERGGFRVLRFWDDDALLRTEAVLESILAALRSACPHPSPLPQAGEGKEDCEALPQAGEGERQSSRREPFESG